MGEKGTIIKAGEIIIIGGKARQIQCGIATSLRS
jgi:hypothetical protein